LSGLRFDTGLHKTIKNKLIEVDMKNKSALLVAVLGMMVFGAMSNHAADAQSSTVFNEDFEGYSSFPDQNPVLDFVNNGIAQKSEGAKEIWYGGRFQTSDGGTIDSDLAVQKLGGGTDNTHVGRMADDAGLLFHISTLSLTDVKLSFDYRTFLTESTDKIVVGFYTGSLKFGACTGNGEAGCYRDFLNQDFGGNQTAATTWWNTQWTQIVSDQGSSWKSVNNYLLPSNQQDVWVAFWLNNGNGDFGKIDNIKVLASTVPEPVSSALFLTGGMALSAVRMRKKQFENKSNPVYAA
jgi:hypothetical protein